MKLQTLQILQIFIECKIMVGCRWWVCVCVGFVWCLCARVQASVCVVCGVCCVLCGVVCRANMFASCKKQLSWYDCASLAPLGMKWACICAGNGRCVCQYVIMCQCVLSSLCCWLRQCWRRCVGCCVVVTVQKEKKKTRSVVAKKCLAREFISITVLINSKNFKPH